MHKFRILAHNVTNNILTTMTSVTNNVPDVTSTLSINSDDKKKVRIKMDCYILYTLLSVIVLLFILAIICYHYTKYR